MKITGAYGGASYNLSVQEKESAKSGKELATGKKLNSSADDPAGMAIVQRMEAQSKEYAVKVRNLQNEISSYQVAESGLGQISDNLGELRELAVQSGNGTLSDAEKKAIKAKADNILKDIDNLSKSTEFNTKQVIEKFSSEGLGLVGADIANTDIMDKIDEALKKVSSERSEYGAKINGAGREVAKLTVANENSMAAISKIADADMLLSIMNNTRNNILQEANNAVTAQSKISQQRVLDILKD